MQGADQILHTITELKAKVPTDPHEADLLSMAEMIAEDQKPGRERERHTQRERNLDTTSTVCMFQQCKLKALLKYCVSND